MTLSSSKRLLVRPSYPSNKLLFKINLGFRGAQGLQTGSLGAAVSFRFSPPPSPPGSQAFGGFLFAQITGESDFPLLHISF